MCFGAPHGHSTKLYNSNIIYIFLQNYDLVGVRGLEPPASASQTRRASQLRHTPTGDVTAVIITDRVPKQFL